MPFLELLLHLKNNDDSIVSGDEENRYTAKGHRYVRAREGMTFDGQTWRTKFIWVRY